MIFDQVVAIWSGAIPWEPSGQRDFRQGILGCRVDEDLFKYYLKAGRSEHSDVV